MNKKTGVTLLETLLVIGVLSVLAVTGAGVYRNYSKNVELEANAGAIISDLKSVQSKSINGEQDSNRDKWGIHFENGAGDYYEIFSTSDSYTVGSSIKRRAYLTDRITFSSPTDDIIFNKIRGTVDVQKQVVLTFEESNKTITVTAIGTIY